MQLSLTQHIVYCLQTQSEMNATEYAYDHTLLVYPRN